MEILAGGLELSASSNHNASPKVHFQESLEAWNCQCWSTQCLQKLFSWNFICDVEVPKGFAPFKREQTRKHYKPSVKTSIQIVRTEGDVEHEIWCMIASRIIEFCKISSSQNKQLEHLQKKKSSSKFQEPARHDIHFEYVCGSSTWNPPASLSRKLSEALRNILGHCGRLSGKNNSRKLQAPNDK